MIKKYFQFEEWEHNFQTISSEIKSISDYTGLDFREINELPLSKYLLYKRDAWITSMKKSEEGREFLKTVWKMGQVDADVQAVRQRTGKGGI